MAMDFSYSPYDHVQQQQQDQQQYQDQEQEDEEDYINMEVSSYYSNFLKNSPIHPQPNDFEFRAQSGPLDWDPLPTTSPADELFYKGKLLPLHLPPRLQIMQTLLNSTLTPRAVHFHPSTTSSDDQTELYTTPLATTPATGTPFLSCNVSPVESCHVSKELDPEEYFLECSNEEEAKKPPSSSTSSGWSKKLRLIKHPSLLGSKIKASRAYIKHLFGKSDDKGASKRSNVGETKADAKVCHRRSFSGAFKLRVPVTKMVKTSTTLTSSSSSGSSCSSNSNGANEVRVLKRCGSANSELESAIAGAIAHCKQSNTQVLRSRKTLSEIGLYTLI